MITISEKLYRPKVNEGTHLASSKGTEEEYINISNEYNELVKQQDEMLAKGKKCSMRKMQIKKLVEVLTSEGEVITEYDDKMLRQLVERIYALPNNKIRFEFKCGIEIEVVLKLKEGTI